MKSILIQPEGAASEAEGGEVIVRIRQFSAVVLLQVIAGRCTIPDGKNKNLSNTAKILKLNFHADQFEGTLQE